MNTERLTSSQLEEAAGVLTRGGLLGIPTETVYGLGADGLNEAAVRAIFDAKGRPQDNPLILHIPSVDWLARYCVRIPEAAYALAERFWPGPLTMILERGPDVPDVVTAGLDTVGMRCPAHPLCREVIALAGRPVAAPSGNRSGRPSPTTAAAMLEDMDGRIHAVLDGGPCAVGVESTIIDLTVTPPRLLRPGGVTLEELESVLGEVAVDDAVRRVMAPGERPRAPGMKYRHYAPKAPVTVVKGAPERTAAYIRAHMAPDSGVICFSEYAARFPGHPVEVIGPASDRAEHARRVFDALRAFDRLEVSGIWAQSPGDGGIDLAVTNRLNKAAGFHIIDLPMKVIGITGPTGAGKTTALQVLRELGAEVIDADRVYHRLLEDSGPLRAALTAAYGPGVLDSGGRVDRRALAQAVYPDRLEELGRLTHPFVVEAIDGRLAEAEASGRPAAAIDAIALIESGLGERCDAVVAVTAPLETRIRRIMARDGIDEGYARRRAAAQKGEAFFRAHAHYVLESREEDTPETFSERARLLFTKILTSQ